MGVGHAAGPFFPPFIIFFCGPVRRRASLAWPRGRLGGASRERERVGGGPAEWGIQADRSLIPVASRLDSRPPVIDLLKNIPQRRIFSLFLWALEIGRFARGRFSCLGVEPDFGTLTRLLTISISWRLINPNIPRWPREEGFSLLNLPPPKNTSCPLWVGASPIRRSY